MRTQAILVLSTLIIFCPLAAAEQAEIAREEVLKEAPRFEEKAGERIEVISYDEYSWVKQGSRKGYWNFLSNRVAYLKGNIPVAYTDFIIHDRLEEIDYAFDFGSYLKFKNGYIHGGVGFGADIDYIYEFKAFTEIEHNIINTLFLNVDGRYLNYESGNVYILSPGLVYYFGDHYISANYGISFIEDRDTAQFGILKGNFFITQYLHAWAGMALGERLYDIFTIEASKQYGYILFAGLDFSLNKDITLSTGWSYSEEEPAFFKKSIGFRVSIKF